MTIIEKIKNLSKKFENYCLSLILGLAAVLRIRGLTDRDFWYDEAFTGITVKEKFQDMITMTIKDVHPPLYYIFTKAFSSFFGYSVFGIRLFSVVFGLLAIWAIYLFAKELFGKKAALWTAFIAAISPFAIQYSQEARMYTMFVFLIIMSSYYFVRALRDNQIKNYIGWGIFLGMACLTHYMGIVYTSVFFVAIVMDRLMRDKLYEKQIGWKLFQNLLPGRNFWLGFLAGYAVFSFWTVRFYHHFAHAGSSNLQWIVPASLGDVFYNIQMFIFGTPLGEMSSGMPNPNEFYGVANNTAVTILIVFLIGTFIYLFKRFEDRRNLALILVFSVGFMLIVYLLSIFGEHFFVARYLMPAAYFSFVYLGVWLANIRWRSAFYAIAVYITLMFTFQPYYYSQGWNELQKELGKYKGNNFYILNSFDYVIGKYYLGSDHLTLYNIDWPQYNPDYWAAIGPSLQRTETFEDVKKDKKAIIIFNGQAGLKSRDDKSFDPSKFELVKHYKNIGLYRIAD